ncbi:MAG TPA: VOC family protein [Actinomycetota bacterium]|jgi:hypothetical protein
MGNPVVHFDINGTDGKQLAEFYGELLGWDVQEIPDANYWLIDTHAGTGINGGIMARGDPFVTCYAEGPDIQALLDKAESLGAKTVLPVTEVPNMVTYAAFTDPQGNRIGMVKGDETQQGGPSKGDGVSVSWFEILGPDPKALVQFYTQLFGWTEKKTDSASSADIPGGFEYHEMQTGSEKGIPGGIGSSPDGQGHVTVYAAVDDIQKYLERAETLGGKTVVPVTTMAETTFAQFADPQGLIFGLFQSQP